MYLKDMMKIATIYNNIKKTPLNPENYEKKREREKILQNILTLISEEDKLKAINQFMIDLNKIKAEQLNESFEEKFIDINKKLILDVNKVDPKKLIEQEIRHKYKDIVFEKKLQIEKEEYHLLKQSYTKRIYRDSDDKKKTLQILEDIDQNTIKTIMNKKISVLEYEKNLRDYNFQNNIIDEALDLKETIYFEAIKEYNTELSEAYLEHEEKLKKEKTQEHVTEKEIKKLYGSYEKFYPYYRK